jgi:hypothetical protein
VALAAVTLGGPARAAAQGTVLSAALSADITAADGSARVRIDYALESDARTVDVELLGFGAATADELVGPYLSTSPRARARQRISACPRRARTASRG